MMLIFQVYKTDYPLESVFSFTSSLYQLPIFEKVSLYFQKGKLLKRLILANSDMGYLFC